MIQRALVLTALSSLVACGPTAEVPVDAQLQTVLRMNDHIETPDLVGVTFDRSSGELVVLDAYQGLFAWRDDALVLIAGPEVLMRDGEDLRPYTDVVAIADGAFAVTVRNDGLRVDVDAGITTQHFCYLPGGMEVESQLTHSVAWDSERDMLFAQPQSFMGGDVQSAQIGAYDATDGGQPEMWFNLRNDRFVSHGMLYTDDGDLLLGEESTLFHYDLGEDRPVPTIDLSELGITQIQGLAQNAEGRLYVADGNRVVAVDRWRP